MEIFNPKYGEYVRRVQNGRELIFRGLVWDDIKLINEGMSILNKSFGRDKDKVWKIMMDLMDEMEEDYNWSFYSNPPITREN